MPAIITVKSNARRRTVLYNNTKTPLSDFIRVLSRGDKERVCKALDSAFNSCATIKQNGKRIGRVQVFYGTVSTGTHSKKTNLCAKLFQMFHGTIATKTSSKKIYPCVKLFVEYTGGHQVFVKPTQIKASPGEFFSELTDCLQLLLAAAPSDKPSHVCGEQTEVRLGFRKPAH